MMSWNNSLCTAHKRIVRHEATEADTGFGHAVGMKRNVFAYTSGNREGNAVYIFCRKCTLEVGGIFLAENRKSKICDAV